MPRPDDQRAMGPPAIRFECVDDEMASLLRSKTPAERLQIAAGMWRFARNMIVSILGREHPEWSQERIRDEAARRLSHGAV